MKKNILKQLTIFLILVFTSTNILFAQQLMEGNNYNIMIPDINPGSDFLTDENGNYEMFATFGRAFLDPRMYSDSYILQPEGQSFEPNIPEVGCFETASERGELPVSEGLVLHLDADAITGLNDNDTVEIWSDLSDQENHASQNTEADRPTYKTNILNGRSVVRFDGEKGLNTDIADLNNSTSSYTVIWVGANGAGDQYGGISRGTNWENGNHLVGWQTGAVHTDSSRATNSNQPGDSFIITHKNNVNTKDVREYLNSGLYNTNTYTDWGDQLTWSIGRRATSAHVYDGDIAEIIIYQKELEDGEREEVEQYLGTKWLDWEPPTPTCSTGPSYLNEYGMVRACGPQGCYNRARFEIDPQGNPTDTLYGVQISTDGFDEDIRYIDGNTFMPKNVRDITDYKTKEDWETPTFNLLGLEPKTGYQLRITALYGDLSESVPSSVAQAVTALSEMSFRIGIGYEDGENINYNPPYEIRFDESFRLQRGANVVSSDRLIWSSINSNAISGITLAQKGEHGGLHNTTEAYTISSLSGDLGTANEGIGFKNNQISQLYSDGITGSLASLVSEAEYDNAEENTVGIIDTVFKKTYGSDGPVHTGETGLQIKTKASLTTPEGNYFEDVTFVLIANY